MYTQKPGLDLQLIANHPGFKFEAEFFQSLWIGPVKLCKELFHLIVYMFLCSYYLTCSCSIQATVNDRSRIGTAEFPGVDARK